jgi:DNA-3-methyladenine glycosylase
VPALELDEHDELDEPAEVVAPRLLGCILERRLAGGQVLRARIVETEAYDQTDAASHSYRGRTPRTEIMFGPAGFLYVYFTYGMHYCCNIVCGPVGRGSAVLLRAAEPLTGVEAMAQNRLAAGKHPAKLTANPLVNPTVNLTNGPAKLCQALRIDKALNGADLQSGAGGVRLIIKPPLPADEIVQTVRIGIKQAVDVPWRFYIKNNPYISKP